MFIFRSGHKEEKENTQWSKEGEKERRDGEKRGEEGEGGEERIPSYRLLSQREVKT